MKQLVLSLSLFLFIAAHADADVTCTITPSVINNVICRGTCTGTATVLVNGGTPPYTYQWIMPAMQTTATATGLCAGTYTVSVSSVGCSSSTTVTITEPPACLNQAYHTAINCNGGTGCISMSPTCGTPPYTYSWSTSPPQTTPTVCGLPAGNYTCTVVDANGCTYVSVATLTQPATLTAVVSHTNVSCNGGNNGMAWVTPGGGTPGYTYQWMPSGGNSQTASNLVAGCYTVTVTDVNGCSATATACVTQPPVLQTNCSNNVNVSCYGGNNGCAWVCLSGGTPPYTYSWTPTGGTGATACNLTAGAYTCHIIDSHGCTVTATSIITQPPQLTLTLSTTNASCPTCNDGIVRISGITGGTAPYTFAWSPISAGTPTVSNLPPGNYTCCITDANGCSTCNSVAVNYNCAPPTVQASNITFSNVTTNSMTVSWTNGNGNRRIVKIKTSNSFTAPVNGNDYTASTNYTSTEQVIYNGTGNTVTVTGLASSTTYWFRVYEAACSTSTSSYYTVAASSNPRARLTQPSQNPNRPENSSTLCLPDQSQELTDGGTSERNLPGYYDGQTFTAGADGLLCEFDLMMFNTMAGTGVMNIYEGSGISGTLLTTQIVNVYVPSGQVWQQWNIDSPPMVKKDSVYTFQFVPIQGGGLPDPYGVNIEGANVYAAGYDLTFPQFDMTFKTYVDVETGIKENADAPFSLYPNPTHNTFTVSFNDHWSSDTGRLDIYDVTGRMVYSQEISSQLSAMSCQLSTGLYLVKVEVDGQVYQQRLVVE